MRKQVVALVIFSLTGIAFAPRALYAKNFFTGKATRPANTGISNEEDSFVDSDHLPLEEEY